MQEAICKPSCKKLRVYMWPQKVGIKDCGGLEIASTAYRVKVIFQFRNFKETQIYLNYH